MFKKMTSQKQIDATRLNAKKSTGPTSPEGKNIARNNGYRHGHTAHVLIETDEDYAAHTTFTKKYIAELAPEGFVETDLAHAAAETAWRINRMRAHENNFLALRLGSDGHMIETPHAQVHTALIHTQTVFENSKEFCNIVLYEQRLTRILHQNLKALQEMQRTRRIRKAGERPKTMAAGVLESAPEQSASTESDTSPENGFAFSNREATAKPQPEIANADTKDAV